MRRVVIVAAVRTPVGTFGGSLRGASVEQLSATVVKAVLERAGIQPGVVDDVVFAQSYASSENPCVAVGRRSRPACLSRCPVCSSTAAAVAAFRRS